MVNKEIIVWSKNNCPACTTVKSWLSSKGFLFEERNIDGPVWSKLDLFKDIPTARSVPQTVVNGTVFTVLDELRKHLD